MCSYFGPDAKISSSAEATEDRKCSGESRALLVQRGKVGDVREAPGW